MPHERIRSYTSWSPDIYVVWDKRANLMQSVEKTFADLSASEGEKEYLPLGVNLKVVDKDTPDYREIVGAQLDREAINRLIRALRRARDQEFGKDE